MPFEIKKIEKRKIRDCDIQSGARDQIKGTGKNRTSMTAYILYACKFKQ